MKNFKFLVYILGFWFLISNFLGCATAPYQPPAMVGIPRPIGGIYHEVHPGDTVWRISKTYGVDINEIIKFNNLSVATKISPGQRLFIPGAKTALPITSEKIKLHETDLFIWPSEGKIISYFGQENYGTRNKGIDIETAEGSKIAASKSGKVVFCSDRLKGLGKTIIIDHVDGFSTLYARNSKNLVKVGDSVRQNQVIAMAGSTGRGIASYLHFEIRRRQKPQNPLYYLP